MKRLRISRLALWNFKGIGELEVRLDGCDAVISGQNGAGKTTIADAYTWVLTGKMTDGRTAEIGCYDSEGRLDKDATHIVELEFTDGTTFRRETNGEAKFYANGVPVKKLEYVRAIGALTSDTVNFLAMPQNFCSLHWQERRQILMSMVSITNAEIIASDPKLEPFAGIIGSRLPEDVVKIAKDQKKKLAREFETIPARIDELSHTEKPASDAETVKAEIAELELQLKSRTAEVARLQKISNETLAPLKELNRLISEARTYENAASNVKSEIHRIETELDTLRKEYRKVNNAANGKCPMCGAKIASERLPEFYERLDQIKAQGAALNEKLKIQERAKLTADQKAAELRTKAAELQAKFDADTQSSIAESNLVRAINERDRIQTALSGRKNALIEIERYGKIAARIEELRRQEKTIGSQITDLERQIYLAELFTSQKIKLTEDAINSRFEFVKWRMFKELKTNGNFEECCEPMIDGVPYGGSLSKGERLKAALDILQALQTFYGVELPVFIDDAESYTSNSLIGLPNQTIRLKAAEGVLKLRIDVQKTTQQLNLFGEMTA